MHEGKSGAEQVKALSTLRWVKRLSHVLDVTLGDQPGLGSCCSRDGKSEAAGAAGVWEGWGNRFA